MKRMARISVLLLFVIFSALAYARGIPTPEMAMKFDLQKDPRKWPPAFVDGNKSGFVMEFVPEGQSIQSWEEMAAQQITFTRIPLRTFVDNWRLGLTKADSAHEYSETTDAQGAITVHYNAPKANEIGIRKFIQGPDGIYMIAYHTRPASLDDTTYETWKQIIEGAVLTKNPNKR